MSDHWDKLGAAGIALVAGGSGWIYPPLGLIVLGLGLIAAAYIGASANGTSKPVP